MQVLIFHPVLLPPRDYGGIERVVLWLAEGLVERGHKVAIAALAGSKLPLGCRLVPTESRAYSREELLHLVPRGTDVVHFMTPLPRHLWEEFPFPWLLTVHGNGKTGETYPKNSVFLSKNHAMRHQASFYIYNGINPNEYRFHPEKKDHWYLFLSKPQWGVKNLKGALEYCKKAQVPIHVAGGNRPYYQRIRCFPNRRVNWIGAVAGHKKGELLARSRALVFPVLWPEPFGLVVAEALVSGTPVIASPRGSLPELLPPGVGSLPRNEMEWIEILSQPLHSVNVQIQAEACRTWALSQFHYLGMSKDYENAYLRIMQGEYLQKDEPVAGNWRIQ